MSELDKATVPLEENAARKENSTCKSSASLANAHQTTVAFTTYREVDRKRRRDFLEQHLDEELIGNRLDHFIIHSLLGRGGMGSVYLAWHEQLHRLCAVKVIVPEMVRANPARLKMFLTEARSAARLHHPHIVTIHSLGQARGYHYIEMEYVDGRTLADLLIETKRLAPLLATQLVGQLATALTAAHDCDILHCDIKPDNVMLTGDSVAKLADFGLARMIAYETGSRRGRVVGTPSFMAPELFGDSETSFQSDIYSLGATYFTLLTGEVAYPAKTIEELSDMHQYGTLPRVSEFVADVPAPIDSLVESMMAKEPSGRPGNSRELAKLLHGIANSLVDTKDLVAEAMVGLDVKWKQADDNEERFTFVVPLDDGRSQTVDAEVIQGADGNEPLFTFRTPCAPAQTEDYEYVLDLNSRLPFGAVGVHSYEGEPYFVMVQNRIRATTDPEEIRASVLNMAQWADRIERELTGADKH